MSTDALVHIPARRRRSQPARGLRRRCRSPRVVCIDDDPAYLQVLEELLRGLGVCVETARDGRQGYRVVLRTRPDLVITDYFLPHEYGTYLLRRLKRFAFTSRLPVMVVTGRDLQADVSPPRDISLEGRLMELGADAVYSKPLEESLLQEAVRRFLS